MDTDPLIPALGAHKSPDDYRNIPFSASAGVVTTPALAYQFDMSKFPVWHQRKIGACVGHALAKAMQIYWYQKTGTIVNFSARFLYAMAKCQDGVADEGTYPSLVAKIMRTIGCATEDTCPNDTTLPHEAYVYNRKLGAIPSAALIEAAKYRIPGYAFVNAKDTVEVKSAIEKHGAVAMLMQVGKEWFTSPAGITSWAKKDIMPLRPPAAVISGHEVVLYGFDPNFDNVFNSWSEEWADNGKNEFREASYRPFLVECIAITELPGEFLQTVEQLPTKETFKHNFTKDIVRATGAGGTEVEALQTALMIDGVFDKTLYTQLLKDDELGFYGSITATAVMAFQRKHSVALESEIVLLKGGTVGPKTRTALNLLFNK